MAPRRPDRREVLRASASAVGAMVAGCAGRAGEAPTRTEDATDRTGTAGPVDGSDDPAQTGTPVETSRNGSVEGILLPSLDVDGSPGGLVDVRPSRKVALLDFFATWCAPCKPEMANLRAARDRFSREEVSIVSITQETDRTAIKRFWDRYRGNWPVVMDPGLRATRKYGVTTIPTIVVFAPDGTRTMRHTGLAGEERIVEAIEDARGTASG